MADTAVKHEQEPVKCENAARAASAARPVAALGAMVAGLALGAAALAAPLTLDTSGAGSAADLHLTAQAVQPLEPLEGAPAEAVPEPPTPPTAGTDPSATDSSSAASGGATEPARPPSQGITVDIDDPHASVGGSGGDSAPDSTSAASGSPIDGAAGETATTPPSTAADGTPAAGEAAGTPPATPDSTGEAATGTSPGTDSSAQTGTATGQQAQPDPQARPDDDRRASSPTGTVQLPRPGTGGSSTADTNLWLYGGIAAVVLLLLAVAVVLVLRRRAHSSPDAADVATLRPQPEPTPRPEPVAAKPAAAAPAPAAARAPAMPPAVLRDLSGTTGEQEHPIRAAVVQIGRAEAEAAGVQSVVVRKKTVGRRHAVIEYRNHTYWLVDQGSLNGTYVNGIRVDGEVALRPGARIRLESAEFEFTMPGMDPNATMVAGADEFAETMVAPGTPGAAPAPPAGPAGRGPTRSQLETLVNQEAPAGGFRPGADTRADEREATAPAPAEDVITSLAATGTVDFDVFGDSGAAEDGNRPGTKKG